MKIACFGRRYMFSACHRLHAHELSEEANRTVYGKCNNPHGHGHNYVLEVMVRGAVSGETGMVINMADIDEQVSRLILDRFDHSNLNLDPFFVNRVPTTENLCITLFELLSPAIEGSGEDSIDGAIEGATLERVRVEETENNFFEYAGSRDAEGIKIN